MAVQFSEQVEGAGLFDIEPKPREKRQRLLLSEKMIKELFGSTGKIEDIVILHIERMLEALNKEPDAEPKKLLDNMKGAVDEFVGEAPQFDDLTMMAVKLF